MHVGGTARCLCYANANPLSLRPEQGVLQRLVTDGAYSSSSMSNVPG